MNNPKHLLITGASGFLGTWLAREASKLGYLIYGIDLRTPLQPQLWSGFATTTLETVDFNELLAGIKITAVYHLAGSASVGASVINPYSDFSSLLPGTSRLAIFIAKFQPQARIFLFSSAAVYGNPELLPITEESTICPISPYGVHKAVAEVLMAHYARIYDIETTIFRPFSVYGPELRKQLIWDVSQRALTASELGQKSILLYGTGKETRDFIYIKDLCHAAFCVLSRQQQTKVEVFNLASGDETSIFNVAASIIKHLGIEMEIVFDGSTPKGDPLYWRADMTKIKQTGFACRHTLDQGLERVSTWVKAVY